MSTPSGRAGQPLPELARRLAAASVRSRRDPETAIDWPASIDPAAWFMRPEWVSAYDTPWWEALDTPSRQRLSFYEAVNFFSLNIHGERQLMAGLARRLYAPGLEGVSPYIHHFLAEENNHSLWFATFCTRYAGAIYPDRAVTFPSHAAPGQDDVCFFARVVIFEEIVDRYNQAMAADDRVEPVARQINANHHAEEIRHLAFGRRLALELWAQWAPTWSDEVRAEVRTHLDGFVEDTWRSFYRAEAYRDAGLAEPWALARRIWSSPAAVAHRERVSAEALAPLVSAGVLTLPGPPAPG
ncbi:MAG: diiron oxygenase [Acidimicrobiales bacterium]